jgi:hypothetical protein
LKVIAMVEKQSANIGRDARLAILLRHKWRAEIERAVDKVKLGIVPGRKRNELDKWFRKQWYRSMMRDRKRKKKQTQFRQRQADRRRNDEPIRKH